MGDESSLCAVDGEVILDAGNVLLVLGILFEVLNNVVNVNDGVYGEAELLLDLLHSALLALTLFLAVNHDEGSHDLGALYVRQDLHALTNSGACGDDVLNNDVLLTGSGYVTDEGTTLTVILDLLAVEEEGILR